MEFWGLNVTWLDNILHAFFMDFYNELANIMFWECSPLNKMLRHIRNWFP